MSEIRAFVGHSFTDDDEIVVGQFLKYLDQLSRSLPDFKWVDAKAAQPEELAAKVLRLISECNTIIAICTKKELVTQGESLRRHWWDPSSVKIRSNSLTWKTSDWIIQEIGLAKSRQMSIIILLEAGCRSPGGLQGDVEYISFERAYPERAFGKLLEMLEALNPRPTASAPVSSAEIPKDDAAKAEAVDEDDVPDETWDLARFENAFFWKLLTRRFEDAEKISNSYLGSNLASSEQARAEWNAHAERMRITWGKNGQLSRLRSTYLENQSNPRISADYAAALAHFKKHSAAADLYLQAVEGAQDFGQKQANTISAVLELARGGRQNEALALLDDLRQQAIGQAGSDGPLASCLMSLADIIKDEHLSIEAMERLVELMPDDYDTRFSLAYAHSQIGNVDLALEHYLLIPEEKRTPVAWNNLGVCYQNLSIHGRAISAYRKAADGSETLAMSNLAYRYISAGFLEEARGELDRAMAQNDPHRNVGEAFATLSDIPEKETKQLEELRRQIKSKADFYQRLSNAILSPNAKEISAQWVAPECTLRLELTGNQIRATGIYTTEGNSLLGLFGAKQRTEYQINFVGSIIGRRAFGDVERRPTRDQESSLLDSLNQKKKFSMIFNDDYSVAEVAEDLTSRVPRFYRIEKSADKAEATEV